MARKFASTGLKLALDPFRMMAMADQAKWYSTPQIILLGIGLGILIFISGFGIGKWFGSDSLRNQHDVVFADVKVGDQEVKVYGRDVLPSLDEQLRALEREKYHLKRQKTEDLIFEKLNLKKSTEDITVSNDELKQFAAQRNINFSKLNSQQRNDLEENYRILKAQISKRQEHQALLSQSDSAWKIPLTYHRPKVKAAIGAFPPVKLGRGKGTLVVFANYHCPSCSSLWSKLEALNANLHVRYRVSEGDALIVRLTALGSFCAHDQGKFVDYHKAMVAVPPQELSDLHRALEGLQIKREIFDSCMSAKGTEARLLRDVADSTAIGIASQTIAVVNDVPMEADEPIAEYMALLGY